MLVALLVASSILMPPILRFMLGRLGCGLVLVLFYVTMLVSVREKSPTMDELGHATAGYSYWAFDDYRIDPENGNLTKRWISLPSIFQKTNFPSAESKWWQRADARFLSDEWFYRLGNPTQTMLWSGRAMSGLIAVAFGAVVWMWSRKLFGPIGAMISLLLYVLSPGMLGNGPLMTSDMAVAFLLLLSTACITRCLQRLSAVNVALSATVMGALFLVKMSALAIVPVAIALVAIRIIYRAPWPVAGSWALDTRARRAVGGVVVTAIHIAALWAMIWACFGFRYSAFRREGSPGRFSFPWEWALNRLEPIAALEQVELAPAQQSRIGEILTAHSITERAWSYDAIAALKEISAGVLNAEQRRRLGETLDAKATTLLPRAVELARDGRLLPEAYLYGWAHVWRLARNRGAFLNGKLSRDGWLSYFPYTFAVKTPLTTFAIFLLAVAGLAIRWRAERRLRGDEAATGEAENEAPWLPLAALCILFGVYWGIAIISGTNIGHRHLLPVYGPLFVVCGAAAWWLQSHGKSRRLRVTVLACLLLLLGLEMAYRFPNYLSYFNGIVAPRDGFKHLIDSSVDWGQDLPALARQAQIESARNTRVYYAYFGVASPRFYGVKARDVFSYPGAERWLWPVIMPILGCTPRPEDPKVAAFLAENPEYDSKLIMGFNTGTQTGAAMLRSPDSFRLSGGTYLISASLMQPLFFRYAGWDWSPEHEKKYQELTEMVKPLFTEDGATRVKALEGRSNRLWQQVVEMFAEYRFARLSAYLRGREPDAILNNSVLVFRLRDEEVEKALHGPAVFR